MSPADTAIPHFLRALRSRPDTVWIRDGLGLFGWGERLRFDPGTGSDRYENARHTLAESCSPFAFASFTFDEQEPDSVVIVPSIVLRVDPAGTVSVLGNSADIPAPMEPGPMPSGRLVPDQGGDWLSQVWKALSVIDAGDVEKVVLSRIVSAEFEDDIPKTDVVERLLLRQGGSHTFSVAGLVGSSPELLVSKEGGSVRSLSLAGSADRMDPGAVHSLESAKTELEHTLAADSVEEALAPFCSALSRLPTHIETFGDIHHMATGFEASAVNGVWVTDLLGALHPTAAVAGTPTKAAIELIREIETHDRGRYAGPVGWLDATGDGEFAIALRCADIEGRSAILHSGAGLVRGSDAEAELEETRFKLRPMRTALGLT